MSSQGVSTTAVYMAYNTSTGGYQTGDVGNHTLRLIKDGTEAAPTNAPSEVDSTNAPGAYKLTMTAAETQFGTVWIGGKSSTANVILIPITLTFEILPTALDGNGNVKADVVDIAGAAVNPSAAQLGVNLVQIAASASAAANLAGGLNTVASGTVGSGASTASIPTSAFSPAGSVAGQFIGRTLIFADNTSTAALQGQATTITGSTGAATPTLTVAALTTAPAAGDTFYIF